jgi:hypothetical protein
MGMGLVGCLALAKNDGRILVLVVCRGRIIDERRSRRVCGVGLMRRALS